jgi:hypothetical protein
MALPKLAVKTKMSPKDQEYIDRLAMVIRQLHDCGCTWVETVPVHEVFNGQTVWKGDVEVFNVAHPKAKRAYAWSHLDGNQDERTRFVAVLEIPPVDSALTAVRVSLVKEIRKKQAKK